MKKRNDKGFTLVELIVVLVILAILAAILVPALLGYIDKAREKQVTTNAEAAYVAAQALYTEAYGKSQDVPSDADIVQKIKDLTDINEDFSVTITANGTTGSNSTSEDKDGNVRAHKDYIISVFVYQNDEYKATWKQSEGGNWTVEKLGSGSGSGTP